MAPKGKRRARRVAPWLLAVAGGVLWASPFGVEPRVVAAWLALAPLVLLLSVGGRRTAFGLGWAHGTAFWLASIPWIAPTLQTFGELAPWLSYLLLLAVALYLGLFTGVFALLGALVWRRLSWPASLVALPALWVVLEWLRGRLLGGFPWNLSGYAWTEVPGALALASTVGVWGVSYLVVFANCGVAAAFRRRRWEPLAAGWLVPLLLLGLAVRFAVPAPVAATRSPSGAPVRIVQPAIYNQVEYDPVVARDDYRRLMEMTDEACDLRGSLVVWPESAAWPFELERDPRLAGDVGRVAQRCPVLLNSTRREDGDVYFNSAYLVDGSGAPGRYDKRHLVPFGEYVPLAGVFAFLDHLARNAGGYTAAEEITLLPWRPGGARAPAGADPERLGLAICFEVTFPAEVAELVQAGATVLVTLTNDAWYGDSAAPRQHFRAARWRAAETGRPLLRAAITGISAVIEPDGTVRRSLDVGEAGILRSRIVGRAEVTPFVRAPWAAPALALLTAAFAIIFAVRRSRS